MQNTHNSIQVYLYNAFHDAKQLYIKWKLRLCLLIAYINNVYFYKL